jgi:hypothetical protein
VFVRALLWRIATELRMPYSVKKDDPRCTKPYAVVKDDDDKLMGCHDTLDSAERQRRALYAAAGAESRR